MAGDKKTDEQVEAGEESVELQMNEVEVMTGLARLDLESALCYEAAAAVVDDEGTKQQLLTFAKDHRRHVEALDKLIRKRGAPAFSASIDETKFLLPMLGRLAHPLGDDVVLMTLLNNEHLTNSSYRSALEFEWEDDIFKVLEAAAGDEDLHFDWLVQASEALEEEIEDTEIQPAQA